MRRGHAVRAACLSLSALLLPGAAGAHFFVQPYTLPVPFSMYAYAAAAALLLSFLIAGAFVTSPTLARVPSWPRKPAAAGQAVSFGVFIGRGTALLLLTLTIATGLFGTPNPFANFSMTFFWIVFVLAVPYAVAVFGDFYAPVNPWRTLVDAAQRLLGIGFEGRVRYPQWLGHTPALLLYMAFIWLELFGQVMPRQLALLLLAYTAVNLLGAFVFGREAWFRHGEFFGVFLSLLGRMSLRRRPLLPEERPMDVSLVLFILFMLASTAFDGLHATAPWAAVFWKTIYPQLAPWFPAAPGRTYVVSVQLYHVWQWCVLWLSPLIYLAVVAGFLALARRLAGSHLPLRELAGRFAMSLVPIAFVYHVAHYYTLLLAQAPELLRLVSDPFGWGWNLFGTARLQVQPVMIDVETIWHTQVALILLGHIVAIYLAHLQALRTFATPARATLSQLPMLVLMVLLTTFGLWILSLPLTPGT